MSGFRDPYANPVPDYMRHNYQDSADYNYNNNNYGYNEYNPTQEHQPPPLPQGQGQTSLDRSNSVASRYTTASAPRNDSIPHDSDRTLPAIPQRAPEDEFPAAGLGGAGGPNLLRKGTNRGSYGAPLDRDVTRQSLTPLTRPPGNSAGDIKRWRQDHHSNLWTKGSRGRCIGRFCCCTLLIALILFVSIVLSLIMWVRPPDIQFTGIQTIQNGSTFEATTNQEFKVNLGFGINVTNPNYFSATFTTIQADIIYPINNTNVGGGTENDITFNAHSNKAFTFPFSFVYSKAADPNGAIIQDLVKKCGIIDSSTKTDLSIQYKISLKLKVLVASVGPSFSGTANFECPLSADEVRPFLSGLGINIPGLSS